MPSYSIVLYQNEYSQVFAFDGIVKRYIVNSDQLNMIVNGGLAPGVYFLPDVYLSAVPWDADDPYNPATRGAGAVLPPTKGAQEAPPDAFEEHNREPRRGDE